jgi:hypothetical protein
LTSIESADGTLGRPGMVMISPQIATMNSAPAESRTSRTGMVKPVGAPLASGWSRTNTASWRCRPAACRSPSLPRLELVLHRLVGGRIVGAVDLLAMVRIFSNSGMSSG